MYVVVVEGLQAYTPIHKLAISLAFSKQCRRIAVYFFELKDSHFHCYYKVVSLLI